MSILPLAGVIVCAMAGPLSAQADGNPAPIAAPIRVTTTGPAARSLVGVPVRSSADTIRIVLSGRADTVALPATSIRRIEELRGRRSNWDRGALAGALVLGVAGAIAAPLISDAMDDSRTSVGAEAIGVGFAGGALAGAVIGAGVGALSTRDRWSARPLGGVRRVGTRDRVRVGVAMAVAF